MTLCRRASDVAVVLASIKVGYPLSVFDLSVELDTGPQDEDEGFEPIARAVVRAQVPDRDQGLPVQLKQPFTVALPCTEEELLRSAMFQLSRLMAHEVQEAFLFKGVRVFDPHK